MVSGLLFTTRFLTYTVHYTERKWTENIPKQKKTTINKNGSDCVSVKCIQQLGEMHFMIWTIVTELDKHFADVCVCMQTKSNAFTQFDSNYC